MKTLHVVRRLWQFLELSADLMCPRQSPWLVRRALRELADTPIAKRRARSCPRAMRQSVSCWPRLHKNTSRAGAINYFVGEIYS